MVIGVLADQVGRSIESATHLVSETFFEPVIRLGVTGLSRAGKTVFITSLVANLLDRGRMPGLEAARSGRIETAFLRPQPDDTVPRFAFESHRAALLSPQPHWPEGTRQVSELRLSLRVRPQGLIAGLSGARTIHLDIVDYPGEWLLDLGLLDRDFAAWSAQALDRAVGRPGSRPTAQHWTASIRPRRSTRPRPAGWHRAGRPISPPRARRGIRIAPPAGSSCQASSRAPPC